MKINNDGTVIEIVAEEGKTLTQLHIENEDDRIFGKVFCLGKYDTPDNYTEWSDEEAMNFDMERESRKKDEEN